MCDVLGGLLDWERQSRLTLNSRIALHAGPQAIQAAQNALNTAANAVALHRRLYGNTCPRLGNPAPQAARLIFVTSAEERCALCQAAHDANSDSSGSRYSQDSSASASSFTPSFTWSNSQRSQRSSQSSQFQF